MIYELGTFDPETGEVAGGDILYLEGHPRQYRFDAKEGVFNINGTEKLGKTLTFQPIAWRIFAGDLFKMGVKQWAELFFIDKVGNVSTILFHGYSVDNILRLMEPLHYERKSLADTVITIIAERKENTNVVPKGFYYIATFSYAPADPEETKQLKAFAKANQLYRQETLVAGVQTRFSFNFPAISAQAAPQLAPPEEYDALPFDALPEAIA